MIRYFYCIYFLFIICLSPLFSQVKIGNNPATINSNSLLELESTNKTFVMPRMTSIQMMNIVNPLEGSLIFNNSDSSVYIYRKAGWRKLNYFNGSNALYVNSTGDTIKMGRNLTEDTKIGLNNKNLIYKKSNYNSSQDSVVLILTKNSNVGIGTSYPHLSSILELNSTTQGFLPPRMTYAQRDAIVNPAAGLIIFNTEMQCLNYFNGTYWNTLCGNVGGSRQFNYTGSFQTFTVPAGVTTIKVELYGASGGDGWATSSSTSYGGGSGGWGGIISTYINVTPGSVLRIYVGGQGNASNTNGASGLGGYNGGANGGSSSTNLFSTGWGANSGGGGGATDIRESPYSLSDRLAVAGGGGGGGAFGMNGGDGILGALNTLDGSDGVDYDATGGKGGTQTAGGVRGNAATCGGSNGTSGTSGNGGAGANQTNGGGGGGGGGGYYGGGGGGSERDANICTATGAGGGGGSCYSSGNGTQYIGSNYGNGYVILYW